VAFIFEAIFCQVAARYFLLIMGEQGAGENGPIKTGREEN
jgi:hypothetical protein